MEKPMENSESKESSPNKLEIITITDTHNDYEAILRNLKIHNIIDENGEWRDGVNNVQVIHTGDVINKKNPDKKSLEYMFHLKATAPESCSVEILAGNHEMEYLMGTKGIAEEGSERKLIEGMSLISASGPVLFLHGYPTRKLLRWILSYVTYEEYSVPDAIGEINRQFSEALEESSSGYNNKLKHFLFGEKAKKKGLVHEAESLEKKEENTEEINKPKPLFQKVLPADYYQKHGKEVSELLAKLGIEIVVHGHARTSKGIQRIGEFSKYLPNVTLIDNDVAISEFKSTKPGEPTVGNKWGSTKIIMENSADGKSFVREMSFINKDTFTNKN
jgi:hypothetical protein